jgi:hypothetical protein
LLQLLPEGLCKRVGKVVRVVLVLNYQLSPDLGEPSKTDIRVLRVTVIRIVRIITVITVVRVILSGLLGWGF